MFYPYFELCIAVWFFLGLKEMSVNLKLKDFGKFNSLPDGSVDQFDFIFCFFIYLFQSKMVQFNILSSYTIS